MINEVFSHIPGIGEATQSFLVQNGIKTWQDFLNKSEDIEISYIKRKVIESHVNKALNAYLTKDYSYFAKNIPKDEHWRLYPELKENCCFLDIETNGLDKIRNIVTVIGLYDREQSKIFVHGKNMHLFEEEIKKYDMIITFNGRCFDVPFLQNKFPNVDFENKLHIDLRFVMKSLGYSGGLKYIERALGIARDEGIQGVDGFEAVRLWNKYKMYGDEEALNTLIEYNKADIEHLEVLMEFAYKRLSQNSQTPDSLSREQTA